MKKRNTVFALVLLLLAVILGGCASDGYNTQKGAAIGAGLGAIAGQVIGHDTTSTLIGAGVGTLVGAVAGNAMDQNVAKQQTAGGQGAGVAVATPARQDPPGKWVEVPGSWQGGKWVPAHTVWVPVNP
jgi:hypothetical protein